MREVDLERASGAGASTGRISASDLGNFMLLIGLYMLQGVPLGLASGSIPFLLQQRLTYSQIGIFTLATYPYALKLGWSAFVDSVYSPVFGRRKSWIIPMQLVAGLMMWWIGSSIEILMAQGAVASLTLSFFLLVFFVATQDIAVDGWAVDLSTSNFKSMGGVAQTVGMNIGYFMSFTVFLALNSVEFSNRWFFSEPQTQGLVGLSGYIQFWALSYLFASVLLIFKEERPPEGSIPPLAGSFKMILKTIMLPKMKVLLGCLLVARVSFAANDALTAFKLIERGFKKEWFAMFALIEFPIGIILALVIAKYVSRQNALSGWMLGYGFRIFFSVLGPLLVYMHPVGDVGNAFFFVVLACMLLISLGSNIMFVCQGAFFAQISDSAYGGSYVTLLNTVNNLGASWPRFLVLELTDLLSDSRCVDSSGAPLAATGCMVGEGKAECAKLSGQCEVLREGYYYVAALCLIASVFVVPLLRKWFVPLQHAPDAAWRLQERRERP